VIEIYQGDNQVVLAELLAAGTLVDAVLTDPPYGISFMGKQWDYDVPTADFWRLVYEVLKPGGHVLSFGGARTYHRMVCNLEDAGFEIRDQILWLFGSGFPKSLNISKAIDRAAGAEGEVVSLTTHPDGNPRSLVARETGIHEGGHRKNGVGLPVTAPATDEAKAWSGWGSALKPAHEPIVLARKPFRGTLAENIVANGAGALNIDACRVGTGEDLDPKDYDDTRRTSAKFNGILHNGKPYAGGKRIGVVPAGRWPANLILDEDAAELLDEQSGNRKGSHPHITIRKATRDIDGQQYGGGYSGQSGVHQGYSDAGGASRFFYTAKAPRDERNGSKHPTVKPLSLVRYLVRLVTPPGGIVLDPFAGTGTTGDAAMLEGFRSILIEREPAYVADIRKRLSVPRLKSLIEVSA
jgi:DNA modification methylase